MAETVIVLRAGSGTDDYGDDSPGTDVETAVDGCAVAPRYSSENNDNRSAVVVGITVYFPAGSDVLATDRMRVRDTVYRVDGEPGRWVNPFTNVERGLEVAGVRVSG